MSNEGRKTERGRELSPPAVLRGENHRVEQASLVEVIEWFLTNDPRVGVIRHPSVEELFQWKQQEEELSDQQGFVFNSAEDRLAIGIFQALETNRDERELHAWISNLLAALDDSAKVNEEISGAYGLASAEGVSPLSEAEKIPSRQEREFYLRACWLEALCTAEVRVLGWIYQGLYGRSFHPNNLEH